MSQVTDYFMSGGQFILWISAVFFVALIIFGTFYMLSTSENVPFGLKKMCGL